MAASIEANAEVESIYRPAQAGEENGVYLMDRLAGEQEDQERVLNNMVLKELLGELGEKEREVIVRRYFLNQTQTQIAGILGISQVQVSRLEKKILKQMKEKL